jgi:sirohydrochlorin cobaltochelatase
MQCKRWVLVACLGLAACSSSASTPATTPVTPVATKDFGVLVMAHGGSPEWNAAVEQAIAPMRAKYPVEVAFGMADATTIQSAVQKLESQKVQRIGVVRLFISGESWYERTEQILGIKDGAPAQDPHAGHDMHAGHGGHSMAFFRLTSRAAFEMSHEGLVDAVGMGKVLADRVR